MHRFDRERADAAEMMARCSALVQADAPVRAATVFVLNLSSRQRIQVDATAATTVAELKRQTAAAMGLRGAVELIFCGRKLEDQRTVDDYSLLDGTLIHVRAL